MTLPSHIAVLMGGWSQEREVSLESGACVVRALQKRVKNVRAIDVTQDLPKLIRALTPKPDFVFNALHGRFGEDGCIQALLDMMDIRYSHSDVRASAIAMNKHESNKIARTLNIAVPDYLCLRLGSLKEQLRNGDYPMVIKPVSEGSSVGVHILHDFKEACSQLDTWAYGSHALVQKYIKGRELTVGILQGQSLGVMEITSHQNFYDYQAKYKDAQTEYHIPAPIPPHIARQAEEWAKAIFDEIGCRAVSRVDFLYDDRQLYFLEINSQPGLTSHSLLPALAEHRGMDFDELIARITEGIL